MFFRRAVIVIAVLSCTLAAAAQPNYSFAQLTEIPEHYAIWEPTISGDGQRIAFNAGYDFTGENPDGSFEIYLYENGQITQLTYSPMFTAAFNAHITADGEHVVFRSTWDFTGQNWDRNSECFVVRIADKQVTQITDEPSGVGIHELELSRDGRVAVLASSGDPLGSNPDRNSEIFRLEWATGAITQITSTTGKGAPDAPDIDDDGSRIVFRSSANFDGSNPNENIEVWLWDEVDGIRAVTATNFIQVSGDFPVIDGTGRYVAFRSHVDFTLADPTLVDYAGFYLADLFTGTFAQISPPGYTMYYQPVISPDGAFVLFESMDDLIGGLPAGSFSDREIFYYDTAAGVLSQLTDTEQQGAPFTDDARYDYVAIARNSSDFVIRNEVPLDPNHTNDGNNIELFVGRIPRCDLSLDGDVGPSDFAVLRAAYGACIGDDRFLFRADYDGDGCITALDYQAWIECYRNQTVCELPKANQPGRGDVHGPEGDASPRSPDAPTPLTLPGTRLCR